MIRRYDKFINRKVETRSWQGKGNGEVEGYGEWIFVSRFVTVYLISDLSFILSSEL